MPDVSIVIVTYNSINFINACLGSVSCQSFDDSETIVVDNGSIDGTVDFIRDAYPAVTVVENETNVGACRARNQGIEIAKGKYVLTLDCDVTLGDGFIREIKGAMERAPADVGMLSPKILRPDKKTVDSTGLLLSRCWRFYDRGSGELDTGRFDKRPEILGPCSAAALYKMEMLDQLKVGGEYFDENFFFLVEDFDIALRARHCGWKAVFTPRAICYHVRNSSGKCPRERQYLSFRNRYLLMLKNFNLALRDLPFYLPYDIIRDCYLLLVNKKALGGLREVISAASKILVKAH